MKSDSFDNGNTNAAAIVDIEEPVQHSLPARNASEKTKSVKSRIKTAAEVVRVARAAYDSGRTRSLSFRKDQLRKFLRMVEECGTDFENALAKDLRKHKMEANVTEIMLLKNEVHSAIRNLSGWARPEHPCKPVANLMDGLTVYKDPYGVALIIGSWNFPINLVLAPLIPAIAAGNCVVLKPSEVSPMCSKVLAEVIPKYLDNECYQVYTGGVPEATELLEQRFDFIFFTGSTSIGKIIHRAANKYLTPTVLELGGKSPVYLDDTVNMDTAAKRILWGKCVNSGQACIAPDYILCTKTAQDKFLASAKKVLKEFFPEGVEKSEDYPRIVTAGHYNRLVSFLNDKSKIAVGGRTNSDSNFIEPTILINVSPNDLVMQEEIFGPILPIVNVEDVFEAIKFINAREKPLALYVFSRKRKIKELLLSNTSCGGGGVNEVLLHFATEALPFGGVAQSGMGAYHGKAGFDAFTHRKGFLEKGYCSFIERIMATRYPPYTDGKHKFLAFAMRPWPEIPWKLFCSLCIFLLGVVFAFAVQFVNKRLRLSETYL